MPEIPTVITPPADMPYTVVAMLQATIAAFWAEYPGDPNDSGLFWDFLTENMANVPRETSGVRRPVTGEVWHFIGDPEDQVEVIFVGGSDSFGPDPVTYRHTNCPCRLSAHALKNHQSVRPMPSFLGLYAPNGDVPRETSLSVEDKFPYRVDVIYQVNSGSLRTAQRTVQARDGRQAEDVVRAQLTAAYKNDTVTFGQFDTRAVADGGLVLDVPRETLEG